MLACRILRRFQFSITTMVLTVALFTFSANAQAIDVANQTDWNTAIAAVAAAGSGSTVSINIVSGFTLTSSMGPIVASNTNVTVNITGNGNTVNGNSRYQAISVNGTNSPTVNISNLTINAAMATGGNGGNSVSGGGGGGLGAGGGLFVQTGANVTLQDVSFTNNKAQGGNGGTSGLPLGGGGGGGGLNGGNGSSGGSGPSGNGGTGGSGPLFPGSGGSGGLNGSDGTTGGGGGGSKGRSSSTGTGGAGGFGGGGGGAGYENSGQGGAGGLGAGNGGAGTNVGTGTGGSGYGGAVFVMNGATLTIKASTNLTYSGNTTTQGTGGSPSATKGQDIYINGSNQVVTFQVDSGSAAFTGSSQTTQGNIAGDGGITKTGLGTLTLGGTNTFTGPTSINAGTLSIGSASNLGATSGLTIGNGTTLAFTGTTTLGSSLPITIMTSSTFDVASGVTANIQDVISEGVSGSSLIKSDTGTLILSGINTYTGSTNISGGTLQLGIDNALPSSTNVLLTGSTSVFDVNGHNQTIDALIGIQRTSLVSLGAGTLNINGSRFSLFAGDLTGTTASALNLSGTSSLFLTGNDSGYLGTSTIGTGSHLAVNNNQFGGSVIVNGTLSGNGTIAGNVTVQNGTIAPSQNNQIQVPEGIIASSQNGSIGPQSLLLPRNSAPAMLTIGGNYVQQASGTYHVLINSAGQSDRLNITGSASLNGKLVVQSLPGNYVLGTMYTILHANDGISGKFSSFTDDLPMLQVEYNADNVFLDIPKVGDPTFASFAKTFNQLQVGQALDVIRSTATGSTATLINQLSMQNAQGIQSGLQQLDAELIGSLASIKIESSDLFLRSTMVHLQQFTAFPTGSTPSSSFGSTQAMSPSATSDPSGIQRTAYAPEGVAAANDVNTLFAPAVERAQVVGWLQGVGEAGQLSSNGNASGLNYSIGGTVFGVDLQGEDAILGISGGYGHTYVGQSENLGNGQIDSLNVDIYGLQRLKCLYVLGLIGYASDDYSTRRYINIGNISSTARGDFMGNEFQTYLETGINIPAGEWTVQPLMSLRYLLLGQNGFDEYNGGGADLTVNSQTYDSLRYSIGMRLTRVCGLSVGCWSPYLEGCWTHEVLNNDRLVDAQFAGITGGSFVSAGNVLGRDFGEFGAGFMTNWNRRIQLYVGLDAQVSSRQSAEGGTAGFQLSW